MANICYDYIMTKEKLFNLPKPPSVGPQHNELVIFDVETNGLTPACSVLSISALKVSIDLVQGTFHDETFFSRYYYPKENYNSRAIAVNGLTAERIVKHRENFDYPHYFAEDIDSFSNFIAGVQHFIGHNISFDTRFLPFSLPRTFCTMFSNTSIVKAAWMPQKNDWKWPSLQETARHYNINIDPDSFHDSNYDVLITYRIFKKMFMAENTRDIITKFILT